MVTDFGVPIRWDVPALEAILRRAAPEDPGRVFDLLMAAETTHVSELQSQIEKSRPKSKKR